MYDYDRTAAAGHTRLPPDIRRKANAALDKAGFGGRKKWRKVGMAITDAFTVLAKFGIELDEIISAFHIDQPKGTYNVNIAFTNPEDSYSPTQISNSVLHLSWTDLTGKGQFEVIAYLS